MGHAPVVALQGLVHARLGASRERRDREEEKGIRIRVGPWGASARNLAGQPWVPQGKRGSSRGKLPQKGGTQALRPDVLGMPHPHRAGLEDLQGLLLAHHRVLVADAQGLPHQAEDVGVLHQSQVEEAEAVAVKEEGGPRGALRAGVCAPEIPLKLLA